MESSLQWWPTLPWQVQSWEGRKDQKRIKFQQTGSKSGTNLHTDGPWFSKLRRGWDSCSRSALANPFTSCLKISTCTGTTYLFSFLKNDFFLSKVQAFLLASFKSMQYEPGSCVSAAPWSKKSSIESAVRPISFPKALQSIQQDKWCCSSCQATRYQSVQIRCEGWLAETQNFCRKKMRRMTNLWPTYDWLTYCTWPAKAAFTSFRIPDFPEVSSSCSVNTRLCSMALP